MTTYLKGVRETLSTYDGSNTDTDNAKQRLSGKLWGDFDFERALVDDQYGWFRKDPWKSTGQTLAATSVIHPVFSYTEVNNGGCDLVAGPSGFGALLELDSDSTTDSDGAQIQFVGDGVYLAAGQTLYFEAMLRAHDVTTQSMEFFCGHATIDTTLIASAVPSAADWIGYYTVDGGLGLTFGVDDGDDGVSLHASDVYTLVDGDVTTDGSEWVHLGYKWTAGQKVEAFANGVDLEVSVDIDSEPDGFVVPSFVCQSLGTIDPLIRIAHTCWAVKY